MEKSKQKNLIIGGLLAIVLIMAVGYAAFATNLNINGTSTITSNWCVGFDNTKTSTYEVTKGKSTGQAPTATMSYSGTACGSIAVPNATLNATLNQPGDRVVYTLTILNKGSVPAQIDSVLVDNVEKTATYTETKGNIKFTVTMPASSTIAATSGSTTMTVTAEFQNDTDISDYSGETQSINIKVNAGQTGSSPAPSPTPGFVPQYYEYHTGSIVKIGQSYDTSSWTQDSSTLNKDYYLGHDVENGVVTANYACFILNNTQYCMKGTTDRSSFTTNKALLGTLRAAGTITCSTFDDSEAICSGGSLGRLYANSSGGANAGITFSVNCYANNNGNSDCYE